MFTQHQKSKSICDMVVSSVYNQGTKEEEEEVVEGAIMDLAVNSKDGIGDHNNNSQCR